MALLDLLLVLGVTLRLTRLLTVDDLGWWLVRSPAYRWAARPNSDPGEPPIPYDPDVPPATWRQKLVSGLDCPFCAGFWIGAMVLLSLALCGGPGDALAFWRYAAGAFTLSYVSAHVASRLD